MSSSWFFGSGFLLAASFFGLLLAKEVEFLLFLIPCALTFIAGSCIHDYERNKK